MVHRRSEEGGEMVGGVQPSHQCLPFPRHEQKDGPQGGAEGKDESTGEDGPDEFLEGDAKVACIHGQKLTE